MTHGIFRFQLILLCCSGLFINTSSVIAQVDTQPVPVFKFIDSTASAQINQAPLYSEFLYEMARGMAGGVAAADFDEDGDIDLFIPNGESDATNAQTALGAQRPDLLYINNTVNAADSPGTNTFSVIDFSTLVVSGPSVGQPKPRSRAALWLDYDGDRLLDLMVFGDCFDCCDSGSDGTIEECEIAVAAQPAGWFRPHLFRQRHNGTFEDVSDVTGLSQVDLISDWLETRQANPDDFTFIGGRHGSSLSAGDIDGDGYPEVLIGLWTNSQTNYPESRGGRFLLNKPGQGGRFFEETSGVLAPVLSTTGKDDGSLIGSIWQSIIADVDGDDDLDIVATTDGDNNRLWINETVARGAPLLDEKAQDLGLIARVFDMGLAMGDYDNDADFDFYISEIDFSGLIPSLESNLDLFRNDVTGPSTFIHDVDAVNGAIDNRGWGWGTIFADVDSDGWQDVLLTNGMIGSELHCHDRSRVFLNLSNTLDPQNPTNSGRAFFDLPFTPTGPFADAAFPDTRVGSALVSIDYDRDGDLDLFQTVNRGSTLDPQSSLCPEPAGLYLYENVASGLGTRGDNLTIRVRGAGPNSHAIGAKVHVVVDEAGSANDLSMTRAITAGISLLAQEPAEAHFGLGHLSAAANVIVTVDWVGDNKPSTIVSLTGANILADPVVRVGWCSYADLAEPFGTLDVADVNSFLSRYYLNDPTVDFALPYGVFDFNDVSTFQSLMGSGCNLK